ncbi:4'-phosphopantetheinyl transferase family protein [Mariniphaga sp.]|uniref:4'-phosphopantetheinyl transferase family protein n=1 Tax=Mariniphaga sp. TaxID=1954475 RepID=UPI0035699DA8
MSEVFCGTLETWTRGFNDRLEVDLGLKLYKIELSKYKESISSLKEFLSPFEKNRANRYHFSKDKNRFIICRTVLKFLLAEQTGLDVNEIVLDKYFNKKPYLPSHPSVFFNVTHADDYAVIAIAKKPIGVDIEYVNEDFEFKEILLSFFNKSEIDYVLNSNDKQRTFYKLWTRKEAIVKATGKGIDDDFPEIVSLDGYHHLRPGLLSNIEVLQAFSFELNDDYIGAVACSGSYEHAGKLIFYPIPVDFQKIINTHSKSTI